MPKATAIEVNAAMMAAIIASLLVCAALSSDPRDAAEFRWLARHLQAMYVFGAKEAHRIAQSEGGAPAIFA